MIVIRAYEESLSGVRAVNPELELHVVREPELGDERVLRVEYPGPQGGPASRDVWCEASTRDWTQGRALAFRIKPANALKLSVSFRDWNGVAYTTWAQLEAGVWQPVRMPFDAMRPNPYFQPPDAKTGAPLDVSDVKAIGFAPQDAAAGSFTISAFQVVE